MLNSIWFRTLVAVVLGTHGLFALAQVPDLEPAARRFQDNVTGHWVETLGEAEGNMRGASAEHSRLTLQRISYQGNRRTRHYRDKGLDPIFDQYVYKVCRADNTPNPCGPVGNVPEYGSEAAAKIGAEQRYFSGCNNGATPQSGWYRSYGSVCWRIGPE